jgi:hypothetical protein
VNRQNDFLDRMRIASPCSVGWERMSGDEKVRYCAECKLHVYNISEMSREQVASLIASKEGRICARLYRRADGSVLTKDCPVGLRALRQRVSRRAGAALTAVLSLCSVVFAQTKAQEDKTCTRIIALKIKKTTDNDEQGTFKGVVLAEVGIVIPGATVTLIDELTGKSLTTTSADDGAFQFTDLATGTYRLEINSAGFKPLKQEHLAINSKDALQVTATVQIDEATALSGVVTLDMPQIEESGGGRTVINTDMIKRLPLP